MNKKKVALIAILFILILGIVLLVWNCGKGKATEPAEENMPRPTPMLVDIRIRETTEPDVTEKAEEIPDEIGEEETSQAEPENNIIDGAAFTLTICGSKVSVAYGVDEKTLDKSPGWLMTSSFPGEEGVCVVYGHRNRKHLLALKNLDYGDVIKVTTEDGREYDYKVESIDILDSDGDLKVPTLSGKHIMISTCYPFYYTGHAPKKYVVLAVHN